MDMYANIQAFVGVGKARSFTAAARQLGVSKSVVSEGVRQLEEFVGQQLLLRSTRHLRLSPVGHDALSHCEDLVERTDRLLKIMADGGARHHEHASDNPLLQQ